MSARAEALRGLLDDLRREPRPHRPLPDAPRLLAPAGAIERLAPFAAATGSPGAMRDPALVGVHVCDGRGTAGDGARFARVLVDADARSRLYHAETGERLSRQYPETFGDPDLPTDEIARPVSTRVLRAVAELALASSQVATFNPPAMVALVCLECVEPMSCRLLATALVARSEGHYVEAAAPFEVSDYCINHGTDPSYFDPRALVDALKGAASLVTLRLHHHAPSALLIGRPDGEVHLLHPLHPVVLTRTPA